MRNNTQANRGRAFEELIERLATKYRANGTGFLVKIPTRFIPIRDDTGQIVTAKVDQKAEFDFIGHYKGTPVAIEAKHTNGARISLSELKPNQSTALQEFQAGNLQEFQTGKQAAAVVYISFGLSDFYRVPVELWIRYQQARREKEFGLSEGAYKRQYTGQLTGRQFETTGAASLTPDDLLAFRVKPVDLLDGIISETEPFRLSKKEEETP